MLRTATALAATGLLGKPAQSATAMPAPAPGPRPNILFVLVDEMRFPSEFPAGIHDAAGFLKTYMPRVFGLWRSGVKFSAHYTAAVACTPARGTLITGLYSQQSWLAQTITAKKPTDTTSKQPQLNPAYPTYGSLLRAAGYTTPYIGKWHVSILNPQEPGLGLEPYGFTGRVYPDPTGSNLQGTVGDPQNGYLSDGVTAEVAADYLKRRRADDAPWCLTVSFVNPHDKEFFWAGTEFQTFNNLFVGKPLKQFIPYSTPGHPPIVSWGDDLLKSPQPQGYAPVPANWETAARIAAEKPSTQTFVRAFSETVWGGASDHQQAGFHVVPYPVPTLGIGTGKAPYAYWSRGLDCYTQTLGIVDGRIGQVLDALPADVAQNTVIVFASDHGEYAGAHGFLQGKLGTCYEEAYHVPLIVVDPSGRFTDQTDVPRVGLTSSVDLLRMLVSFGHNGSQDWLKDDLDTLYGGRHDLIAMLRSADAPGRDYVLLASDELVPGYLNFNGAPIHILGLRTASGKLGTYSHWLPLTDIVRRKTVETELYDYATADGRAELDNLRHSPLIGPAVSLLFNRIVPRELRAPLPTSLRGPQLASKRAYLQYAAVLKHYPPPSPGHRPPPGLTPFGEDF